MNQQLFRSKVLADFEACPSEIEELLNYNSNVFDRTNLKDFQSFSLADADLSIWQKPLATGTKIFEALKPILVQLQFPIQKGISQTEVYRAVTLKGQATVNTQHESGLQLQYPEKLQLKIHHSLAGSIPVLLPKTRADFVSLVQALTKKNEPEPIPDSMGACIVANYNNWGKINQYRHQWSSNSGGNYSETDWQAEFRRLIPQKQLYRDCFIILSDGFYSGVTPREMNLSEAEWRRLSLTIRLEHECTHYFTYRVLGSMRNNLLDELIADYQGIVAAVGEYRADWFLRFMGLESFPNYRTGGRLQNYHKERSLLDSVLKDTAPHIAHGSKALTATDPQALKDISAGVSFRTPSDNRAESLSTGAFKILQKLVKAAAENLEYFDRHYVTPQRRNEVVPALTCLTLEELASVDAPERILQALERLKNICV